ncbi:MAG TPA: alcohol dehydrogenase catalytic domain-containing protein [Kofleriaceae bacterium]|nr:alcohol dehydrogenase catalytic domain-containing protein [Kofleriaceae bacterium]
MTARAWRRASDRFELTELTVADPAPADDRVVVAVEAAAIDPWTATPVGRVPGVAAVGRVTAAGAAAAEWLGARVLVPSHAPCGECELCRRGGAVLCPTGAAHGVDGPGALATVMTAAGRWLCRLDGALELPGPAAAALGGEIALAYALYARAGVGPREPAIVWGRGALARLCATILAAKGAPAVVATDDAALAAVSTHPVAADPAAADAALRDHGARPRKVLVTDGDLIPAALAAAGPRATVVVATGPGRTPVAAASLTALRDEVTLAGVAGCHPDLVPELAALAVRGDLELASVVEVVAVADLPARLAERAVAPPVTTLVATI